MRRKPAHIRIKPPRLDLRTGRQLGGNMSVRTSWGSGLLLLAISAVSAAVGGALPPTPPFPASPSPSPSCTIRGTAHGDHIMGTPGDDVICAGGGDDVIES